MYVGYLRFGGNVLINNELTRGYALGNDCPMAWYERPYCDTLHEALDEQWPYIDYPEYLLPWYDAKLADESSRFLGVYGVDFSLVQDSTRQVPAVEGITDGGVIGRTRKGMKRMRVRAVLVGRGRDALDYGLAWFNAAIDPDACGQVSEKCGTADLEWFVDCPPSRADFQPPLTDAEYEVEVDSYRRVLRTSAAEGGAYVTAEFRRGEFFGYEIEVDFVSETPHILGVSKTIPLDPASPGVVQDVVFNLVPVPSAELPDAGHVVLQTNFSTNPSVETNATGWLDTMSVLTGSRTGARSTETAANGVASYKVALTTSNSGSSGELSAYQDVALPAYAAGQTFSFSIWGFLTRVSGTATLTDIRAQVEWRTASASLGFQQIGTGPASGGALSATGLARPATATIARVFVGGRVATWSSGAVLNLFADALVASLP